MKDAAADRQKPIVDWFDNVYRRKGDRYLRPRRAYYVFLELLQVQPDEHLLDVACGLGRLLEAAREYRVNMHGVDISHVAVQRAALNVPRASITVGNAECLPYADKSFDVVTCIGSLERVLNTEAALAEMKRVGKADARYCVMVRNSQSMGWRWASVVRRAPDPGNAAADSLQGWRRLFEASGFEIKTIYPDQYPLHLRKQWLSLNLVKPDYRQPVATDRPLEKANEFIFLLEKRA